MSLRFLPGLFGLCCYASVAGAAPCVSNTFDVPIPGATNVVSHVSDVPSAQFPAFWQEGILDGLRYKVFASLEGEVRSSGQDQDWGISLNCSASDLSCDMTTIGTPPTSAIAVSQVIEQCLLGIEKAPVAPETPRIEEPSEDTAADEPPAESICSALTVTERNDVAKLQRLLVLAGQDPGKVDGKLGQNSFAAIEAFESRASTKYSVPELIERLETFICNAE